jgi:hypothetical protein
MAAAPPPEEIRNILGNGASTDSKHDFQKTNFGDHFNLQDVAQSDRAGIREVLESIPEGAKIPKNTKARPPVFEVKSEIDFLLMLLGDLGPEAKRPEAKRDPLGFLKDNDGDYPITTIDGITQYNVKTFDLTEKSIPLDIFAGILGKEDTGGTVNLLIDASSVKIMETISKLTQPTPKPGEKRGRDNITLDINLLVNRESANDPAGKVVEFMKNRGGANVVTDILIDRDPSEIIYSKYTDIPNDLHRDKFFSLFDIKLGPLMFKQSQRSGKATIEGLNCNVEFTDENGTRIYYSSDPKTQNSITYCIRRLVNAFKGILNENMRKSRRNDAAAAYASKRSGDWFQVLSSKDKNRTYFSLNKGKEVTLDGIIFLVTHDIVLLAYALYNKMNVIFTHKTGNLLTEKRKSLVVFINSAELVIPPEVVLQQLNADYKKHSENHAAYKEYVTAYDKTIRSVVEGFYSEVMTAFGKIGNIKARNGSKSCMEWLRVLWKIKGIDYTFLGPIMTKLEEAKAKANADADIEKKKEAVSLYTNLFLKMQELEDPNKMRLNLNAFHNDTDYLRMVNVLQKRSGKISRNLEDPGAQTLRIFNELKCYLTKISTPDGAETFYDLFKNQLKHLFEALADKDVLMSIMIELAFREGNVDVSEFLLEAVGLEAAGGGGGGGGGAPDPPHGESEEVRIYRGKLSWIASEKERADIKAEEEMAEEMNVNFLKGLETVPPPKNSRIIAKTLTSFGNLFREGAQTIYGRLISKGGGSLSKVSLHQHETKYKFLYIMYIYEIYRGLLNTVSEHNLDSDYYVELAAIALAVLETHPNYLDRVQCFYNILPKKLKDPGVAFLARQVGLHALDINYLDGNLDEIPPYGITTDLTEIMETSERILRGLGTTYNTQRKTLLSELLKHIYTNAKSGRSQNISTSAIRSSKRVRKSPYNAASRTWRTSLPWQKGTRKSLSKNRGNSGNPIAYSSKSKPSSNRSQSEPSSEPSSEPLSIKYNY